MGPLLIAARRPLFLAVLLAGIITGLWAAPWMFPLGVAVYLAAVVLAARDPRIAAAVPTPSPSPSLTSPTFQALISEIDSAQGEVERSVAETTGPLASLLVGIRGQTKELVSQAHDLAGKGQIIEQYLATVDTQVVAGQIKDLNRRLAVTGDTYTRQQLEETRAALVEHQQNAAALQIYFDRVIAQLQNIAANLANVQAEIIRLRTADAATAGSTGNEVAGRLRDLNADMTAFQRVLDTAISGASSP